MHFHFVDFFFVQPNPLLHTPRPPPEQHVRLSLFQMLRTVKLGEGSGEDEESLWEVQDVARRIGDGGFDNATSTSAGMINSGRLSSLSAINTNTDTDIHYPSDFVATNAGNRKKFEMLTFPFAFCGLFCTNCIPFVQGKETLSFVNPPQRASVDFRSPALFRCHFWCHTVFAIIWQLMCDATASFTSRYRGTLTHGRRYEHRGCFYMCPYKY